MLTFRMADPAALGGNVLHPQINEDLQQLQLNPQPKLWQISIDQLRDQARRDAEANNHANPPASLADTRDLTLTTPHGDLLARLYIPPGAGLHPLWLYFHGGGFVLGSFDDYCAPFHRICLAAPCAILSVDYRLAPEHRFPAAVEDCYAAYGWVLDHASTLNIDPACVAIGGDSAGGNLTAAVCLAARERGLPQPVLQVLIYPVVDLTGDTWSSYEAYSDYGLSMEDMVWFREQYLGAGNDGRDVLASPIMSDRYDRLAPALIQTAEFDVLRDEAEEYARRLAEAGVPVTCSRYLGATHGFALWSYDLSRHAQDEIIAFLRQTLGIEGPD